MLVREEAANNSFLSCSDGMTYIFERVDILGVWEYLLICFENLDYYNSEVIAELRNRESMKNHFLSILRQVPLLSLNYDELVATQHKALMDPQRLKRKAKF